MWIRLVAGMVAVCGRLAQADDAASERTRALEALRARLPEERHLRHSLAVEAITREMAAKGDNVDHWGLAGLLHDIDIGETAKDLARHGVVGAETLRGLGFAPVVVHAVLSHDDRPGVARTSRLDHAVYCADQVFWLASGAGYAVPSEKLDGADPERLWEQAREVPSKKPILEEITRECGAIGLSMPRAMAAVQAASRKLSGEAR
jgi:putative nucleotidyltransferase with HDIG domain